MPTSSLGGIFFMRIGLRRRIIIIFSFLFVIFFCASIVITYLTTNDSFTKIEDLYAKNDLHRLKETIEYEKDRLNALGQDWARWDDAYSFAKRPSQNFIHTNLTDDLLKTVNVDFLLILNKLEKDLIFMEAVGNNIINKKISATFLSDIKKNDYLILPIPTMIPTTGVVKINATHYIVTSQPVLKSDGSGPCEGIIMFGVKIDETFFLKISSKQKQKIYFTSFYNNPNFDQESLDKLLVSDIVLDKTDSNILTARGIIENIAGKPELVLSLEIPRYINDIRLKNITISIIRIILTGFILTFAILIFFEKTVLNRLFKLHLLVKKIRSTNNMSIRIRNLGEDEIGTLATGINSMLDVIHEKSKSISLLLNNSSEAILTFDKDGLISPGYSHLVEVFWGNNLANTSVAKILNEDSQNFTDTLSLFFENKLPFERIAELLPNIIQIRDRQLIIRYRPLFDQDENLTKVMLLAQDQTEIINLQQKLVKDRDTYSTLLKIIKHKEQFQLLMVNIQDLINISDFAVFKRHLHTIKGNLGVFGMSEIAKKCHDFETALNANPDYESKQFIITTLTEMIQKYFTNNKSLININLATTKDQFISLNTNNYLLLLRELLPHPNIRQKFISALDKPISEVLGWLNEVWSTEAIKLNKQVLPIKFETETTINQVLYKELFNSFIHIVRNSIDHGIEEPHERKMINKPAQGNLTISLFLEQNANVYNMQISDDGKGLNIEKIKEKAQKIGLDVTNDEEVMQYIFLDNFSLKENATEISGRGIGLAHVMQMCKLHKGSIKVLSTKNQGTTFLITFIKY